MDKIKRILVRFVFPHAVIVVTLVILAIVGLVYSFAYPHAIPAVQYCSYGISAYALLTVCFRLPKIIKRISICKRENRYISKYLEDQELRIKISLIFGVSINLIYSAFNVFMGFVNRSMWFYSLAGYYTLLTLIRFFLLKDAYKSTALPLNQWKRYRFCGTLLIVMNLALASIVFYIVRQNKGVTYHFIQAIAMAAYTFTVTTVAIISTLRSRRSTQPLISAVKFISLTAALVSMLSLENAMLNVFSDPEEEAFRRLMTALTGAGVCIIVLAIGIYMVIKSTRTISKYKHQKR